MLQVLFKENKLTSLKLLPHSRSFRFLYIFTSIMIYIVATIFLFIKTWNVPICHGKRCWCSCFDGHFAMPFFCRPRIMSTSSWLAMMSMRVQHSTTWTTWQPWPRPLLQPMAMVPSWLSVSWTDTTHQVSSSNLSREKSQSSLLSCFLVLCTNPWSWVARAWIEERSWEAHSGTLWRLSPVGQ